MIYPRTIQKDLEKELDTRQAVVLTGMRRVGKTTLLKELFDKITSPNKVFLDLENPLHRKIFEEENYDNIWANLKGFHLASEAKAYLFLDEIQNLPHISRVVKYFYDHWQTKFFLTGSASFYLKNLFPESLSGRKLIFELFPLTFREFLTFKGRRLDSKPLTDFEKLAQNKNEISYQRLISDYKEYLEFGGFPEVVLENRQERKVRLLEDIFTSFFEKEVKGLGDFRDFSKIRDLIMLLATRVGSKLDIAKLSSELSVSRETIYNYLEFLQKSYLLSLLPKFSKSADRRVAGGQKVFLCDSGLVNILGKVSQGQLFENAVFQNLHPQHALNFYDRQGRSEIDFVVDQSVGLEVKLSSSKQEIANFNKRLRGAKLESGYLVSFNFNNHPQVILATDLR